MSKNRSHSSRRQPAPPNKPKLPLLLAVGGALLLVVAAFLVFQKKPASAYTPAVSGGPSLKVDKTSVDLGDMKLGSTASVTFEISNAGSQPLRFTEAPYIEVKEGC